MDGAEGNLNDNEIRSKHNYKPVNLPSIYRIDISMVGEEIKSRGMKNVKMQSNKIVIMKIIYLSFFKHGSVTYT